MTQDEFKAARKERHLTQAGLARLLGKSLSSVTKYETGAIPIPYEVSERMKPRSRITITSLTEKEIKLFQKKAAAQGATFDQLVADLIRQYLNS